MGGRLPSESVVALPPERVVAFDRNTQEKKMEDVRILMNSGRDTPSSGANDKAA
jgi:hypothetical protein